MKRDSEEAGLPFERIYTEEFTLRAKQKAAQLSAKAQMKIAAVKASHKNLEKREAELAKLEAKVEKVNRARNLTGGWSLLACFG